MEVVEDPVADVEMDDVEMDDVDSTSSISAQQLMPPDSHVEDTMQLAEYHPPPPMQQEDRLVSDLKWREQEEDVSR